MSTTTTNNITTNDTNVCFNYAIDYNFELGTDTYQFRSTNIINKVHHKAIRFGKTNNISVIYDTISTTTTSNNSNNNIINQQQKEYIIGASATSILIFTGVMIWFITIILLRYLGPKRVGIFSGQHRTIIKMNRTLTLTTNNNVTSPIVTSTSLLLAQEEEEEENAIKHDVQMIDNNNSNISNEASNQFELVPKVENTTTIIESENDIEDNNNNCKNTVVDLDNNNNKNNDDVDDDNNNNNKNNNSLTNIYGDIKSPTTKEEYGNNDVIYYDNDNDIITDDQYMIITKYRRQLNRTRIVVLLCTMGTLICVILFLISGIYNLRQSSNNVLTGLDEGQNLAYGAITILNNFVERQNGVFTTIPNYLNSINTICPNVKDTICTDVTTSTSCNFTNIPLSNTFQDAYTFLIDNVQQIPQLISNSISIESDLKNLSNELEKVSNQISSFSWAFGVAAFFAISLLICNLGIAYGIIAVWRQERIQNNQYNHQQQQYLVSTDVEKPYGKIVRIVRHRCMVPIFCMLVVISWIFSMIFVIGSITSADFCYGSPDDTVIELLQQDIIPVSSTMQKLLIFYVEGCPRTEIEDQFQDEVDIVSSHILQIKQMVNEYNSTEFRQSLTETCGSDPVIIDATVHALEVTICNLGLTLIDLLLFFSCDNWRPVYRLVTYDAVCFNGNEGFYYVAWTQFWIVFFAMIMVTLRAAFQPENFINPNPSNHKMQLSDDEIVPIDDMQEQQEEQTAVNTQQNQNQEISMTTMIQLTKQYKRMTNKLRHVSERKIYS